jgi:uncharacterized protein YwqG
MKRELLEQFQLGEFASRLESYEKPAIAFQLSDQTATSSTRSKLGGLPLLPTSYSWPRSSQRDLDFLLQIDLAEIADLDPTEALPPSGILSFFYDLENQPWGYDPTHLDFFRVEFFPEQLLSTNPPPGTTTEIPERSLTFSRALTLPHPWSRPFDRLQLECQLTKAEIRQYCDFLAVYDAQSYPDDRPSHRLFGHSENIQGDMQLEAQLVSNGLYCGDPSGYNDPKAKELEAGADDWLLLLQLDSDDHADLMWGDVGMLYYWIRSDDLINRRFRRSWMTLQCG